MDVQCEEVSGALEEGEAAAHRTSTGLQLMDYRWASKCLAIEHKCQRDFVLRHSVRVRRLPSIRRVCCDKLRGCRPSSDCVREWFDRQDMWGVVSVPWQLAKIPASHRDTLVDLRRDLAADKLRNLHRYRAAADTAQFANVQADSCTWWPRQVDCVWGEGAVVDGALTWREEERMTVLEA